MENLINDYTTLGGQDYMARLILREKGEYGLHAAIAELTGNVQAAEKVSETPSETPAETPADKSTETASDKKK